MGAEENHPGDVTSSAGGQEPTPAGHNDARLELGAHWGASAAVLFLVLAISAYYVYHKPITPPIFLAAAQAVWDLVLAAAMLLAGTGLGRWVLRKGVGWQSDAFFVPLALGTGVLSLLLLVAGAVGAYSPLAAWLLLSIVLLLFRRELKTALAGLRGGLQPLAPASHFSWFAGLVIAALALIALLESLAPPVRYDALVYHLALPGEFVEAGRLVFTPDNPFWGQPLAGELLYVWGFLLHRPQTAVVVGWLAGVTALVGLGQLGARISSLTGWASMAAITAGGTLWASLGWGYVDWFSALYGLAILAVLAELRTRPREGLFLLAGLLAGLAMGFKLSSGFLLIAVLASVWIIGRRDRLRLTILVGGLAALAFAPWLIKNLVATGTLTYPFFRAEPWITPERLALFRLPAGPDAFWQAPVIPAAATILGVEGAPGFAANLGPLLLGLLPAVFLSEEKKGSLVSASWLLFLVGWLVWGGASLFSVLLSQSRLFYGLLPAWGLLAGVGFHGLSRVRVGQVRLGMLAASLVVLVLSLSLFQGLQFVARTDTLGAAIGTMTEEEYLSHRLGAYVAAMGAANDVTRSGGGQVVLLWEGRSFYCPAECWPDAWLDRWYLLRREGVSPERAIELWASQGAGYVLLNQTGADFIRRTDDRYQAEDWRALEALEQALEPSAEFSDYYTLYRIPEIPPDGE